MDYRPNKLVPDSFHPVPSAALSPRVEAVDTVGDVEAIGFLVSSDGEVPAGLELSREALTAAGFSAEVGTSLVVAQPSAALRVAVGGGPGSEQNTQTLRDAAAAFVRAVPKSGRIGFEVPGLGEVDARAAAQALTEGAVLGRYRYDVLRAERKSAPLDELHLVVTGADRDACAGGIAAGLVDACAATVARDLANTPAGHLTATNLADVAVELGRQFGFEVEAFDKEQLVAMGCGGLLGVNMGSTEEPRMIRLRYRPEAETAAHLAMIGKGITYDSGGISLKPSDPMHLLMKMDMGGAAAVLGAFTGLRDSQVACQVTGYLSCTDNMPSGTAYMLGDVLHIRGGRTVEVRNTDAEGRLVMADAIVLANEDSPSAMVDVATLTGAALTSLGPSVAALLGNDEAMVDQVRSASAASGEPVWQLPLEKRYRKQLDSEIADIANLGGPHAGTITAALFLAEFVGETPWAHLDIAGTMQVDADESWRSKGATGFGARLLLELARNFTPPRATG